MLKLDEKKIRKGKPTGLAYQGSKKKISKKITEIIKQNFGTDKPIYDTFGGGGAITAECMLNGLEVHYNDLDKDMTDMFQRVISQDRGWIKTLIVSRDEFLVLELCCFEWFQNAFFRSSFVKIVLELCCFEWFQN